MIDQMGDQMIDQMIEELIQLVAEYKEIDPAEIDPDRPFREMELDSLDVAELVMQIEEEYGVTLELSADLNTVRKVAAYIEARKK